MTPSKELKKEVQAYANVDRNPQPEIESPARNVKLRQWQKGYRFVYIPGEGMWAGDDKSFTRPTTSTPAWTILRANRKLANWITQNPLAVVYAVADELTTGPAYAVTGLYIGGTWASEELGRKMTPDLPWFIASETVEVVSTAGKTA